MSDELRWAIRELARTGLVVEALERAFARTNEEHRGWGRRVAEWASKQPGDALDIVVAMLDGVQITIRDSPDLRPHLEQLLDIRQVASDLQIELPIAKEHP